jgi:hypothetical protein
MTGLDIIKRALRLVGALEGGETPSAEEAADALQVLNMMLGQWANERLLMYYTTEATFAVTANTGTYNIGSGQTWDTTRPVRIEQAFIRDSAGNDYPLEIIGEQRYSEIVDKDAASDFPEYLYYYATHPAGVIKIWPVPTQSLTVGLRMYTQFTSLTLAGTIALPPGYESALCYNLAVELAPEYKEVSPVVYDKAKETKSLVKTSNDFEVIASVGDLARISGGYNGYNVYTDR